MENVTNKVHLVGHLGQEPVIKTFTSGSKMASFSIATDEGYTARDGKKVENTQWHRLIAWGDQAEEIENQLHKGVRVRIDGKLTNRSYEAKDGTKKFVTEVLVNEFELIAKKNN